MADVTQILHRLELGDSDAAEQLLPLVYAELRRLATARMARENPGQDITGDGAGSRSLLAVGEDRGTTMGLTWPFLFCCGRGHAPDSS